MNNTAAQHTGSGTTAPLSAVSALLAAWGLREGAGVAGWTVSRVRPPDASGELGVTFRRGSSEVDVRIRRASDAPRLTRVGELDLSHGPVEGLLTRAAVALVTGLAGWLGRHDAARLGRLVDEATLAARAASAERAQPAMASTRPVPTRPGDARARPERLLGDRLAWEPFPSAGAQEHLSARLELSQDTVEAYRRDGFVVLRGALDPAVLDAVRPWAQLAIERNWAHRQDTDGDSSSYSKAFVQLWNLGLEDAAVRALSHASRIGQLAAQLMGVRGVRIFCENWLLKRPGEGSTGWHQDSCVFPFEAEATITAWIPLQPVPPDSGLIRFARGSHRLPLVDVENINAGTDSQLAGVIESNQLKVVVAPPLALGDVTFHNGLTIHGALGNSTPRRRDVLSISMFADGARVKVPATETMRKQLLELGGGLSPGAEAVSVSWPRTWPEPDWATQARATWSRVRARLLPDNREADLWIHDGVLTFEGPANAHVLAPEGGYAITGLVDCHSHISFPHRRDDHTSHTPGVMNAWRRSYAETGVTLLRDMGSDRDDVSALPEEAGLPTVFAAGRAVLRDHAWPMQETTPEDLRRVMLERIERGAHWVKVFADFSGDFQGDSDTGFTGDDAVAYPADVLADAVQAVHAAGGRVAAHCFSRHGAEAAITAGVDSLEHGWGVDADLVRRMADGGIAWVPLLAIGSLMRRGAEGRNPARTAWIDERMAALRTLLPLATHLGIQIFAGTDWFPRVTVADEILELIAAGVPSATALAGGAYGARSWLGQSGFVEGARADLVLFRNDPRVDPNELFRPELVVVGGLGVTPVHADPAAERPA